MSFEQIQLNMFIHQNHSFIYILKIQVIHEENTCMLKFLIAGL